MSSANHFHDHIRLIRVYLLKSANFINKIKKMKHLIYFFFKVEIVIISTGTIAIIKFLKKL